MFYTIPSQPSRSSSSSPSPLANKRHAPPQNSKSGWDMSKTMYLAGGTGLEQVIAAADDAMPQANGPAVTADALGSNERQWKLLDLLQKTLLCSLPALHPCATLQISYPPLRM